MRIALVTGDLDRADDPALAGFAVTADQPLIDALRVRGAEVARPSWRDASVDWSGFDVAVVRTTWDYRAHRDAFVAWAGEVAAVTSLWNPPDVLRWNTHKSYLLELEDHGAPVVPSAWLGAGDAVTLADLLEHRGWSDVVLKPAVGAGSTGVLRVRADAPSDADRAVTADVLARGGVGDATDVHHGQRHLDALLAQGDVVVQAFQPGAVTQGERSVFVIDGQATHVVRAAAVGPGMRGATRRLQPPQRETLDRETAQLATWVVDATGAELLYARVDLLDDELGAPQVLELECTEPDLALGLAPDATNRFAAAIVQLATR
ncbi:MAG: hypothetical protein JJT89_01475 [Nitriliruptoraceae bacterium]|nr:hypothetical protein [Nitriliruptoraceae bacterium]